MKVLKNAQIAKMYGISRPTVGKWVEAAQEHENNLQLTLVNNRPYIIDNDYNHAELDKLKGKGLKYRNKIGYELIKPQPELYKSFTTSQLIELITNLQNNHLIPSKFTYVGEGAQKWEKYIQTGIEDSNSFYLIEDKELVEASVDYLTLLIKKYKIINIVDVGAGNGIAVKPILDKLIDREFEVRYSGIDISEPMLDTLGKNLQSWFPQLAVDLQVADLDYFVIRDKLFSNKLALPGEVCNLVFFSNTIGNVPDRQRILNNFRDSMSKDDFLWVNNGLDSPQEFISFENTIEYLSEFCQWIPKRIGLTQDMYTVEKRYDTKAKIRTQVLKLNKDVDIEFNLEGHTKTVSFLQDEEIIVWSYFTYTLDTFIEEIRTAGFFINNLSCHPEKRDALVICEVETL